MIRRTPRFVYSVVLFVIVSISCSVSINSPTPAPAEPPEPAEATPLPTMLPPAAPERAPTVEIGGGSLDVEYVYTTNLVTALYHLYGSALDHFVDITLTNSGSEPVQVIIQTEVENYTTQALDTVEVAANETLEVHQDPRLIPEAVDRLNSQKPGNFHIRVVYLDDGVEKVVLNETQQILIYSRRDFVWIPGFETEEEYELWAAWVTPNDPKVEELIRAAADYDPTGIITSGYGDEEHDGDGSVWRRLEAIWEAEANDYRLTYISTMTTFGPNTVQRMRLPAEVLDQASGNCVELAALFASAAEALGLETAIVRIPGHAYTAVRTDLGNDYYYFIETTMIGRSTFSEAVDTGNEEWNDASPHFDAEEEGYAWVDLVTARQKGILPIPWN